MKNRKISSTEFEFIKNLKVYVSENQQKNEIKYKLIDSIQDVFGDSWYNLKDKTRQAIDYFCFLSVERGFFFASPEHIAEKNGISKSTTYDALKVLREKKILFKANRTSRKQNGLGKAVHFFSIHPYFETICSYLNTNWIADQKADWKAEEVEIPCGSKDTDEKKLPTYSLPSLYQDSNKDLHINVVETKPKKIIKYVPLLINNLYANIFGDKLRNVWQKITQAFKTIKQKLVNKDDLVLLGKDIIQNLFKIWKNSPVMTIDEMCAYSYKSARDALYNCLGVMYVADMPETSPSADNKRLHSNIMDKKVKRYAPLPKWMLEKNKDEESQIIEAIRFKEDEIIQRDTGIDYEKIQDEVSKYLKDCFGICKSIGVNRFDQHTKLSTEKEKYYSDVRENLRKQMALLSKK